MKALRIYDTHPGKHQDGLQAVLVLACMKRHGVFTTCIRAEGAEPCGMFDEREGPLQVCFEAWDDQGSHLIEFTQSNLGSISEEERQHLLQGKKVVRPDGTLELLRSCSS